MKITEAGVAHVAKLANLEVANDELAALAGQLSRIVEYVEQLNALDTTGVDPTSQVRSGGGHALREDRVSPRTGSSDAGTTVKLFKVPKVITER